MNTEKEKAGNRPFQQIQESPNYPKVLRVVKSFYFITGLSFLLWITFFDSNNLLQQSNLKNKLEALEEEKAFYEREIKEMEKRLHELNSDPVQLEKFAREKYLFKRKGEDIYVFPKD